MVIDTIKLENLKRSELEIFKHFVLCCEKLGVTYFLMDGSLLGAVRHKGFIPWDDDIDVGMMRKDYEILIAKAQTFLPEYLFLQTYKTDKGVMNNFAKIRDSRTTFIETSQKEQQINHGVYIDIFPLDGFPEDLKDQKVFERRNKLLTLRIRKEFTLPPEYRGGKCKEGLKSLIGAVLKIKYPTVSSALEEREKLYKSFSSSSLIGNFCGAYGRKAVVPKEWYGEGVKAQFEGLTVTIPCCSDLYLKQVYGDYMVYPPKEKRIPHHFAEVIDTKKSYKEYVNTI